MLELKAHLAYTIKMAEGIEKLDCSTWNTYGPIPSAFTNKQMSKPRKLKVSRADRQAAHLVLNALKTGRTFTKQVPTTFEELCQYFAQDRKEERELTARRRKELL